MNRKTDLRTIMDKDRDLFAKCLILTNTAYALVEAADSLMLETNGLLDRVGGRVRADEYRKLKNVKNQGRTFRLWLKDLARQVYRLDSADEALEGFDRLYELIYVIMNRTGGTDEGLARLMGLIKDNFEPALGWREP